MFDDDDNYRKFVSYVFEQFQGQGIDFTNVPIAPSLLVRSSTLARMPEDLANTARPVTNKDIRQALEGQKGRMLLDPEDLEHFHFVRIIRKD